MLRGFRHTLFLLMQVGVVVSGAIALAVRPHAWPAIAICVSGSMLASLLCERIASRYLRGTFGQLRRAADEISRGRFEPIDVSPGNDFYKLVNAINLLTTRLAEASKEEERLQDELRRRERLAFLGELAASVAHEVNNPLDGIQNCVRILRRAGDNPARAEQMLGLIEGGLVRIETIVRRLLALASEHGIRRVDVRIRDVVESAVQAVEPKLTGRKIQVHREFDRTGTHTYADAQLLEQVFVNLMLNAADSMPTGGALTIRVRLDPAAAAPPPPRPGIDSPQDRLILVSVSDTGSGIAADVLPHIFEPFYTTRQGGRGTGLGLPIAARIVAAHHGSIEVSSTGDNGTTFEVRLPVRDESTASSDPRPSRAIGELAPIAKSA